MAEPLLLGLHIRDLTKDEAKEILVKVREIEQRNPSRMVFTHITGTEKLNLEEATKLVDELFPR